MNKIDLIKNALLLASYTQNNPEYEKLLREMDGYVLVEKKHITALKNLGHQMIDKAVYYQDESHIRGFGNSVRYIYKAMIEAQEQNDE